MIFATEPAGSLSLPAGVWEMNHFLLSVLIAQKKGDDPVIRHCASQVNWAQGFRLCYFLIKTVLDAEGVKLDVE